MLVFFDTFKFADNLNYCKNEALLNFKKTYDNLIIIHDLVIKKIIPLLHVEQILKIGFHKS